MTVYSEHGKHDVVPGPSAPADVAQHLIKESYTDKKGRQLIRRWRGDVYIYEDGVWAVRDPAVVRHGLYTWLKGCVYPTKDRELVPWLPNTNRINNVTDALGSLVFLDERAEPPCWLGEGFPRSKLIALENGLLDLGTRELRLHTCDHFNLTRLPFRYDSKKRATEWEDYLRTLWPDDQESIDCLQEIFGYAVSGRTDLEKIFALIGPERSGKGTIVGALSGLVGSEYIVNPTLGSLGENFGRQSLIGKTLAIAGDSRLGGKDASMVVETLLEVSGQDPVRISRKYQTDWNGRLGVRFIILSNEVPHLADASGTIASRFVIIVLTESWYGREDVTLKPKFADPKLSPGILNWALDGLDRLYLAGHFTEPKSSAEIREQLGALASPYKGFVEDWCEVGDEGFEVDKDVLYTRWRAWCSLNGYPPSNEAWFSKNLKAAFPKIKTDGRRTDPATGKQVRVYRGIRLQLDEKPPESGGDAEIKGRPRVTNWDL